MDWKEPDVAGIWCVCVCVYSNINNKPRVGLQGKGPYTPVFHSPFTRMIECLDPAPFIPAGYQLRQRSFDKLFVLHKNRS